MVVVQQDLIRVFLLRLKDIAIGTAKTCTQPSLHGDLVSLRCGSFTKVKTHTITECLRTFDYWVSSQCIEDQCFKRTCRMRIRELQ